MLIATKCQCGAITVADNNFDNSMPLELFNQSYPDLELEENVFRNCNYCVNYWGIDLCNCGSGDKVGKCEGGLYDCINNIPAQQAGIHKKTSQWR